MRSVAIKARTGFVWSATLSPARGMSRGIWPSIMVRPSIKSHFPSLIHLSGAMNAIAISITRLWLERGDSFRNRNSHLLRWKPKRRSKLANQKLKIRKTRGRKRNLKNNLRKWESAKKMKSKKKKRKLLKRLHTNKLLKTWKRRIIKMLCFWLEQVSA